MRRFRTLHRTGEVVTVSSLLVFSALTSTLGAASAASGATDSTLSYLIQSQRATHLLGQTVENNDGQELGTVKDFVVDLHTGRVPFVLLAAGGFLGIGQDCKVAPTAALTAATSVRGILALAVPLNRWRRAPEFAGDLVQLVHSERTRRIYAFYGMTPEGEMGHRASQPAEVNGACLRLATDLFGQGIFDKAGTRLGWLTDILLDLDRGKPALALLSRGGMLSGAEQFAVLLSRIACRNSQLMVAVGLEVLRNAPRLTLPRWQAAGQGSAPPVYRLDQPTQALAQPSPAAAAQPPATTTFEYSLGFLGKSITNQNTGETHYGKDRHVGSTAAA